MTIMEAITEADALKPNGFTTEQKIKWLSDLDGKIKAVVIDTHEGGTEGEFKPYRDVDTGKELLVKYPYSDLYIAWLEANIDYANGDMNSYANSQRMYDAKFTEFVNYYNRTHMPKGSAFKNF